MKSDIVIAQETKMEPIVEIAQKAGISKEYLNLYGNYKAKIKAEIWEKIKNKKNGKLILVTASSPTPAGEGKTTTSIGLAQAFWKMGKKAMLSIREPSMGPCMGMKGGATGGGYSQVMPMEDINLHFTGDIHAVTSANNLLSSIIDNHIFHGNELQIDPNQVVWKRAMDLNDRALRRIIIGLGGQGALREEGFNIAVASEIMAILCLSENEEDLKRRLSRIVVAYSYSGKPIFAGDLKISSAMAVVLKDALSPNLCQTLEHTPVFIHGGPFANIAHGCNSVLATRYGLKLGDYLITEAGFGADLGAEKFFNIKCRIAQLKPDAVVLVTTARSLKYNGGEKVENLKKENLATLKKGMENLEKHLKNIQKFNVPVMVAINVFPTDTKKELKVIIDKCKKIGVLAGNSYVWEKGGEGGKETTQNLLKLLSEEKSHFKFLYSEKQSLRIKIEKIAKEIYGADKVEFSAKAIKQMERIEADKMDKVPVCIAKTQYSFTDDPKKIGCPKNFSLSIKEIRVSNGAEFVVALTGNIMVMPGLPKIPAAEKINLNKDGKIEGLF